MKKFYLEIYRHTFPSGEEGDWVSVNDLDVHPDVIYALADFGVVEIQRGLIPAGHAARVEKIFRLRRSLGVNLSGAAIILDLLERVESLEEEIESLKRR